VPGSVAVIMPTYQEIDNLESIATRLRTAVPAADLLVVDDNSPDGTGDLADKLSEADPQISVMHRTGKEGLGPAYIAGFRCAIDCNYDVVVQMDADGSHQPEHLPELLAALEAGAASSSGRCSG
jgi:dolichol-phosphate mannosyltransferase